eukprot:TRINITY_DN54568_c0_g1_i1.p1 TRINITY_DN54568_c0_g1~~TRINITY_DN54568_c0_g1_i1.p1  ORF type:complete len:477 (+),score=68.95 TRINITY_DN54568_c0_g1_i1:57-1487(+)
MSPAAGEAHTVLIRSDGVALAFGSNKQGQCVIPPLPSSALRYVGAAAGSQHTILLRSDGAALAFGSDNHGQCQVPPLQSSEMRYVFAVAGSWHTVLLRNDGVAIAFGRDNEGQCRVPSLPSGKDLKYVSAAAGWFHTVLVRSDGAALAFGKRHESQCWVPRLPRSDLRYVAVAASSEHTVLVRSDGVALAFGRDEGDGRCRVPPLPSSDVRYVGAAAGWYHTLLLRSDGEVVAFGRTTLGRCEVPPLPSEQKLRYVATAAGWKHTVLLRSDGVVLAFGDGDALSTASAGGGMCDVPDLPVGLRYTAGIDEPPPSQESTAKPLPVGVVILGEDRGGTSCSWETVEGGALRRVGSSSGSDVIADTTKASFIEGATPWQKYHCQAHKALTSTSSMSRSSLPSSLSLQSPSRLIRLSESRLSEELFGGMGQQQPFHLEAVAARACERSLLQDPLPCPLVPTSCKLRRDTTKSSRTNLIGW